MHFHFRVALYEIWLFLFGDALDDEKNAVWLPIFWNSPQPTINGKRLSLWVDLFGAVADCALGYRPVSIFNLTRVREDDQLFCFDIVPRPDLSYYKWLNT